MAGRRPLNDPRRIEARDVRMWKRDRDKAKSRRQTRLSCPCLLCKGTGNPINIPEAERHVIINGRSPECRVNRGHGAIDSSDEEWEEAFHARFAHNRHMQPRRPDGGLNMRAAVGDLFQKIDSIGEMEAAAQDIAMSALDESERLLRPEQETPHADHQPDEHNHTDCGNGEQSSNQTEGPHEPEGGPMAQKEGDEEDLNCDPIQQAKALEDSMTLLYGGSRLTVLGVCIMLLNLKATHTSMSDRLADDMIRTLKEMLPQDNKLPSSLYQMKKITSGLGLGFKNIDGCPNGCILYDQPNTIERDTCPVCNHNRYEDMKKKSRPLRVLRYFPITPRLKRIYRTPSLSRLMRWYRENPSEDGKVRYPADCAAWKRLDNIPVQECDTQNFGQQIQDVRLKLSVDGVNPFKLHRSSWSCWPVLLNVLNLPPWLITKKFFTMLGLIIPGKRQVPFQYFDVWLRPLVDELRTLWNGVIAYDALEPVGERKFKLRAALLFSTHDYPGYGSLVGASHQGAASCIPCGPQLQSRWSLDLNKYVYPGARRWLPPNHRFRAPAMDKFFQGRRERRPPPIARTATEQRQDVAEYNEWLCLNNPRTPDPSKRHGMRRLSILYNLPYWEHLLIRHTVDAMHVEKNFAENLLKTICGVVKKDNGGVRRDMEAEGVRKDLWLQEPEQLGQRKIKPKANYVLSPEEFNTFCTRLEALKVPSGYCSDFAKHIRKRNFSALKSHDFHILMQYLMPLALRRLLGKTTRVAILRCSRLFRRICCKSWNPTLMNILREDVAETLCLMEIVFPPSFFVIMSHLPLHLVEELILLGPVHCRWMYPVERTMGALKGFVRNRARPEASIARGYLLEETIGYLTSYMDGYSAVKRRVWDSNPEDFYDFEVLQGGSTKANLSPSLRNEAHLYVLKNNTLMQHFYRRWELESERTNGACGGAIEWIQSAVRSEALDVTDTDDGDTVFLSSPPSLVCLRYAKLNAYGNHWHVANKKSRTMLNYNSGIAVIEESGELEGIGKEWVGEVIHILELNYGHVHTPIILFMCRWKKRDESTGQETYLRDSDGFLNVNFKWELPRNQDPFVFPSQCAQVFYSNDDTRGGEWKVVLRKDPRSRRDPVNDDNFFIYTEREAPGLVTSAFQSTSDVVQDIAGGILLRNRDNCLRMANFTNLDDDRRGQKRPAEEQHTRRSVRRVPLMRRQ